MSLEGKAAIVTGSDSGIGRAIALELARQGAAVTINYHKNEDAALGVLSFVVVRPPRQLTSDRTPVITPS